MSDCFALLEDCEDRNTGHQNPAAIAESAPALAPTFRSRLYTGYSRTLRCESAADLPKLLTEMQSALAQGEHAVALLHYELGAQQHRIAPFPDQAANTALAEILLFRQCTRLNPAERDTWLAAQEQEPAHVINLRADTGRTDFDAAIARIQAYIAAGDCYQVNYTYRLHFDVYGAPVALYRKLRARQPTRYGALIALPDGRAVLSCSPELFMQHQDGVLTVQPMKGTAAADDDPTIDAQRAAALANDPKNRAENLMIVDLLRNDLGRIAQTGTVQVRELFNVQRFERVLQMTSTVQALRRKDASLPELIAALYPCGSITGAPKLRAMQIIRELENAPRGIYTGALGWFDAAIGSQTIGDFCLSVPIRTLMLDAPLHGHRSGRMGVGAGIVHDSVAADEFEECRLKARFLSQLPHDFYLFETIYATRAAGCRHVERHLQRLAHSAACCGFACDIDAIRERLQSACNALADEAPHRLRLTLAQNGDITLSAAALQALPEPVRLFIAADRKESGDFFSAHKTSVRAAYDRAWQDAEKRGGFDQLFLNQDGNVTEGGRSNIFVRLRDRWYTPPLQAGVLPGVMRAELLGDPAWAVQERDLSLEDLRNAQQIVVCNALRGALQAVVDWD
ncbi:MAG: putative para-aminobenzoate synthase (Aminodeoxychorismate synthase) PabB [Herbaspirillum sp.]|nr:putative para-aminobenzoate synthase (Aminodeoxychorismate synthase) PabB [Herbaspirillum sp.]